VVGAAVTAVMLIAPMTVEAQGAPRLGSWRAGPGAQGQSTYIGRIESPGRRLRLGADLLVSGWFVDTTASGWAGAKSGEVWLGTKDSGGTKLSDLTVGLPRPDVRDALGAADWTNSGFTATIPAGTVLGLPGGDQTLNVYLDTASKGWWFKSQTVTIPASSQLQFPNDPIVFFVQPINEQNISQFAQSNSRLSLRGVALDRNVLSVTDPNVSKGAEGTGIDRVQLFLDGPRCAGAIQGAAPPSASCGMFLGTASLGSTVGVNNVTSPPSRQEGQCCNTTGGTVGNFSFIGAGFGEQFALAGFSLGWNPTTVASGRHSAWAYARSSVTGKENVAVVNFLLEDLRLQT
jgi:hypothetical protein